MSDETSISIPESVLDLYKYNKTKNSSPQLNSLCFFPIRIDILAPPKIGTLILRLQSDDWTKWFSFSTKVFTKATSDKFLLLFNILNNILYLKTIQ